MDEVIFLIILAFIWITFASIEDLKKREVANWLSFSLIILALGYRFFYSLFTENFNFLLQGLFGLLIFLILGNLFYYARLFAGGDAKLMIALGAVLPFSMSFFANVKIFVLFLLLFLFVGGIYGILISFALSIRNFGMFKKEFVLRIQNGKKIIYLSTFAGIFFIALGFYQNLLFLLGLILFLFPYFYFYARAVDESCMVKKVPADKLTEGDWIYQDLRFQKKLVKARWQGLTKSEIELIQKSKKNVLIRQGIPFVPVFWISFLLLIFIYFTGKFSLGFF